MLYVGLLLNTTWKLAGPKLSSTSNDWPASVFLHDISILQAALIATKCLSTIQDAAYHLQKQVYACPLRVGRIDVFHLPIKQCHLLRPPKNAF